MRALTTRVTVTAGVDLPTIMVGGGMPIPGGITVLTTTTIAAIGIANALGGGDTAPGGITAACAIIIAIEAHIGE